MKTIKDVATEAGVSVASVSRAINAPSTVAADTLERILAAVKKLGYTPNKIARSLKAQTSQSVAVLVPDLSNPFQVKIIKGVESVLADAGYTLFIMDTEESPEKEARSLRDLLDRQIDGLVYLPVLTNRRLPKILVERRLPLVFVDRSLATDHDCVRGNNFSGISLLMSHLMAKGRRRIGLVGGPEDSLVGHERNQAFRDLAAQYRLELSPDWVKVGDFTVESGYRLASEFVDQGANLDGVLVTNNLMGIGVLKAFRERGVSLPRDVDLVIFDEIGELVDPPIVHVRQQAFEMGALATKFLLERIQGQGGAPRTALFEPLLFLS